MLIERLKLIAIDVNVEAGTLYNIMNMQCTCDDWVENIKHLDAVANYAVVHGMTYAGKMFVYCPWCAAKLEKEQGE